MKLYRCTKDGVCAGLEISDAGFVKSAAPILGGKSLEGKLGWWVLKQLARRGYELALVKQKRS